MQQCCNNDHGRKYTCKSIGSFGGRLWNNIEDAYFSMFCLLSVSCAAILILFTYSLKICLIHPVRERLCFMRVSFRTTCFKCLIMIYAIWFSITSTNVTEEKSRVHHRWRLRISIWFHSFILWCTLSWQYMLFFLIDLTQVSFRREDGDVLTSSLSSAVRVATCIPDYTILAFLTMNHCMYTCIIDDANICKLCLRELCK